MTSSARRQAVLSGDGANVSAPQIHFEHERAGVHAQKVRLYERHKKGKDWDGTPANDNSVWPLAKALLADGNGDLLKYAMAYRLIYDRAKSEAVLGGRGVSLGDGISLDQKTHIRPCGLIEHKGVRGVAVREGESRRSVPVDEEMPERNFSKVPKPWNGDKPVNDMIDAKRELARLQDKLGPTVEPFEMACIDGATMAQVGNALGVANRAGSMGAGKALCHLALITIRDSLDPRKMTNMGAWV